VQTPATVPELLAFTETTVTKRERLDPFVVRVLLAQRGVNGRPPLFDYDDAAVRTGQGKRPLHDLLGRPQRPDSLALLSTPTPRNKAEGQPWLTGATWPGWPLPQFGAPHNK
jgi:hypothetical protein